MCNLEKEMTGFNNSKQQADGKRCECRECQNSINRAYKVKNREKIRAQFKEEYWNNYEKYKKIRERDAEYKRVYMKSYIRTDIGRKLREARDAKRRASER